MMNDLASNPRCIECKDGFDCEEDGTEVSSVRVWPGWYRFSQHSIDAYPCKYEANCLGGNQSGAKSCLLGAVGPTCRLCVTDFFLRDATQSCTSCSVSNDWWIGLALVRGRGRVREVRAPSPSLRGTQCARPRSLPLGSRLPPSPVPLPSHSLPSPPTLHPPSQVCGTALVFFSVTTYKRKAISQWLNAHRTRVDEVILQGTALFITIQVILLLHDNRQALGEWRPRDQTLGGNRRGGEPKGKPGRDCLYTSCCTNFHPVDRFLISA